eukprot:CAMPEP_0196741314 /NCGR_PEP_ID=MMETSP1091-20130531/39133_1 /TAXON_ID=302021 /ORGANISM="Rhodomonas sp., Strain CCMP768" /LENGTH=110 /DNA_ID=CAMNT_0042086947 /DNA_START=30 /DNA_END=362 /DNA_ORIENTATION=+
MNTKIVAVSALVASASAFSPSPALPSSSLRLRSSSTSVQMAMDKKARAPVVTVFDHRGCSRAPKEYSGGKADGIEDEMMIKVGYQKIQVAEEEATRVLQQALTTDMKPYK